MAARVAIKAKLEEARRRRAAKEGGGNQDLRESGRPRERGNGNATCTDMDTVVADAVRTPRSVSTVSVAECSTPYRSPDVETRSEEIRGTASLQTDAGTSVDSAAIPDSQPCPPRVQRRPWRAFAAAVDTYPHRQPEVPSHAVSPEPAPLPFSFIEADILSRLKLVREALSIPSQFPTSVVNITPTVS